VAGVALQPWPGPIVLAFSSNQGLDLGDVPSILLVVAAGALLAGAPLAAPIHRAVARLRTTWPARPRIAALASGAVLVAAGLIQVYEKGRQERIVAAAVSLVAVGALAWLLLAVGTAVLVPAGWFLAGAVIDAIATPSGTLFAPMLLAVNLSVARRGIARLALLGTAAACAAVSAASLRDVAGIDVRMAAGEGGPARAAALGVVLLVWGATEGSAATSARR
jgi:hypothetical protein